MLARERSSQGRRTLRPAALVMVAFALAAVTPRAFAQTNIPCTPYPGCLGQSNAQSSSATQDLGNEPLGKEFDVSFCQFDSAVVTTSTFNGEPADQQQPDANGCVRKHIEIEPGQAALGAAGHPLAVVGLHGSFAATARNSKIIINGRTFDGGPLGSQETLTVRGVGTNGAPRTVTVTFRVTAGSTSSTLARTGANALRWSPVGLGLLGLGYLLVLASRRRRTA